MSAVAERLRTVTAPDGREVAFARSGAILQLSGARASRHAGLPASARPLDLVRGSL